MASIQFLQSISFKALSSYCLMLSFLYEMAKQNCNTENCMIMSLLMHFYSRFTSQQEIHTYQFKNKLKSLFLLLLETQTHCSSRRIVFERNKNKYNLQI